MAPSAVTSPVIVNQKAPTISEHQTFTSIPVLDFALSQSPETKPAFLSELRRALVIVGFFYLKNPPVSEQVLQDYVRQSQALCELPLEKKLKIDMVNSKHFLGYSRVGCEKTAQITDNREIFDFLTDLRAPGPNDPVWMNVVGPSQWPDEEDVPGCRLAIETYLSAVGHVARQMTSLVAEALDLEPSAFDKFFNQEVPRNKLSVVRYCMPSEVETWQKPVATTTKKASFQGVGPHKDGGFLTYLLQMTGHRGLEAQNKSGQWVPVPPIPGTFTINVGRSLESMTKGVCQATTHRVNLRPDFFFDEKTGQALGARYSSPVFQTLKMDLTREELGSVALPKHIVDLVKDEKIKSDAEAYFNKHFLDGPGKGTFIARLTSHPDVARKWYPDLIEPALQGQRAFLDLPSHEATEHDNQNGHTNGKV